MVREGRVFISPTSNPAYGIGYYVQALEVGAQVTSASSGTTITVRAGHGFAVGDKFMKGTDVTSYSGTLEITSVTATTLSFAVIGPVLTYSVAEGDLLVNLGADTGTSEPNYDGAGLTIYTDMDYSNVASRNTVLTDQYGRYRYWHKGIARWELVRSAIGLIALYTDTDNSIGVGPYERRMNDYATGGDGSEADPWTGWDSFCVEGYAIRFPAGFYSASTVVVPVTISNAPSQTSIIGDGSGISIITITSATGQFRVYGTGSGTRVLDGVRVTGLTVRAGASNTSTGLISLENFDVGSYGGDLRVDPTTSYSTLVGFYILNTENCNFGMLEARGWSSTDLAAGNIGTGLKIYTDDGAQRGNLHFDEVHLTNVTTGLSASSSGGSLDNIWFGVFKAVNSGSVVDGTTAVLLAGNAEQISFGDLHMEVFANGLSATSVENIVVHNGLASQIHSVANDAGAAYAITNGNGGVIRSRIDTVYNGIVLAGTTTRYWIQRMASGSITGAYYTDSSSGGNVEVSGAGILSDFTFGGRLSATGGFSIGTRVSIGAIATGVITIPASPTSNNYVTDTQSSAATDDLDTISGGTDGDIIILSATSDARDVVVKNSTGNIRCNGDRLLNNSLDTIILQLVGSVWVEIGFSNVAERTTAVALTTSASIATNGLSFIEITNTSGTNTPTLVAPVNVNGQVLILRCVVLTAGTITLADSGTCSLSAAWVPSAGDTLTLIASGSVWYEIARSANA